MNRKILLGTVAASALLAALFVPVNAQVPSQAQPPFNTDTTTPVLNLAAVTGTNNSAQQNNLANTGVVCTSSAVTSVGGPTYTFAIQGFDGVANAYQTLVISGTISGPANQTIAVKPGIQTSSLPTNYSAAASLPLPLHWRVSLVVTGGTSLTAKVGCDLIR